MSPFKLVTKKTDALVPYAHNARTHSEGQVAQIAQSIKEFGFTNPVLIDEANVIIAGEGRVRAAKLLKMDSVPCIVLAGLSEGQKAAYVIADNKLALNSGWDADKLLEELGRIAELDLDIGLTGFAEVEVITLLDSDADVSDEQPDWSGMPEFDQPSDKPFRTVIVHLPDQAAVDEFAKKAGLSITDKTKFVWFPKATKVSRSGVVYD